MHDSSGRVPAYQVQSPEFKPPYLKKERKEGREGEKGRKEERKIPKAKRARGMAQW
jgi:hypothetical protein